MNWNEEHWTCVWLVVCFTYSLIKFVPNPFLEMLKKNKKTVKTLPRVKCSSSHLWPLSELPVNLSWMSLDWRQLEHQEKTPKKTQTCKLHRKRPSWLATFETLNLLVLCGDGGFHWYLLIGAILYQFLISFLCGRKYAYTAPPYQHRNCLLSTLFISEVAVNDLRAALPLQLSSALFILASHAGASLRGIDKLGGIQFWFQFHFFSGSQLESLLDSHS